MTREGQTRPYKYCIQTTHSSSFRKNCIWAKGKYYVLHYFDFYKFAKTLLYPPCHRPWYLLEWQFCSIPHNFKHKTWHSTLNTVSILARKKDEMHVVLSIQCCLVSSVEYMHKTASSLIQNPALSPFVHETLLSQIWHILKLVKLESTATFVVLRMSSAKYCPFCTLRFFGYVNQGINTITDCSHIASDECIQCKTCSHGNITRNIFI